MSKAAGAAPSREELLTTQFYEWEIRGRGWQVWEQCVELEPPFRPFQFHFAKQAQTFDDARKPTLLSSLVDKLRGRISEEVISQQERQEEPTPSIDKDESAIVEFHISVPPTLKITKEITELFLFSLDVCGGPISFEVLGNGNSISVQLAARENDAAHVSNQLNAHFPEAVVRKRSPVLTDIWDVTGKKETAFVDLGLSHEFMLPLAVPRNLDLDPLMSVVGALSTLHHEELGLFQILFAPLRRSWVPSIMRAVTDDDGDSFFADAPEILKLAREKVAKPLFAVVVRLATQSPIEDRAIGILRSIAGTLSQFSNPIGNEFIPLSDDGYPDDEHIADIIFRRSRRSGMILNSEELASLAHLPSVSVRSQKLERAGERTKAARAGAPSAGLVLGENVHAGQTVAVSLTHSERLRHTYVLGASGTGKSTFLLNCILQDIRSGEGIGVLDPHGDLIDRILEHIPEERHQDVILHDPSDEEYPIGFNILSAHSELEKTVLSSDLVSVFRRLSTSWGDQMTSVLGNAVLAFLESDRVGTLVDLRRFLVEPEFRGECLKMVKDPDIVYYWQKEYPLLVGRPHAPLLTRLDTFLRPKLIRRMVGQRENKLNFRNIIDGHKIFLAKLAQGAIGEENSYLLGTLLVAKLHQTAIGRQDIKESERKPFYLYIDEFQNFITPSMASILAGARKYGLGLVLAHQDLRQLWDQDKQVASSVIANAYTRVCFRLGDFDAQKLQDGFSFFEATDLQNLGLGEVICRIERAEHDFNLKTLPLPTIEEDAAEMRRQQVIAYSRSQYASKPEDVERGSPVTAPADVQPAPPTPLVNPTKPMELVSRLMFDLQPRERRKETKTAEPAKALPGRGGAQHKYLQQLVKRMAEAQGYRATIEKEVLGGSGKIDVALERADERIACEISVTSTGEHELGNVQKCIAAGYCSVILLATDKKALSQIQQFISSNLEPRLRDSVVYLLPEEFNSQIEQKRVTATSIEQTVRGYRVKVNYRVVNEDEKKAKKTAIAQVVTDSLRQSKTHN